MQRNAEKPGTVERDLKIPEFSDGGADLRGAVLSIAVRAGDIVESGDTLIEVETDKVVLDIPAECGGRVDDIHVAVGDEVRPGQVFARLVGSEARGNRASTDKSGDSGPGQHGDDAVRAIEMPKEDAACITPTTSNSGENGDKDGVDPTGRSGMVPANPSARRLARELGVDIRLVTGSGSRGRITRADVEHQARAAIAAKPTVGSRGSAECPGIPEFGDGCLYRSEPLSGIAAAMRRNMQRAWSTVPHAWLQENVDVSQLEEWRQENKQIDDRSRLTTTVLLAKAIASAIKESPIINSRLDDDTNEILFRKDVDIGVAVDTEHGLLVPVLRSVDNKGLAQLARELGKLVEDTRRREVAASDLRGASITLSNLGGFGIDAIFPIVNHPQVAIVGVGASTIQPVYRQEKFVPRRIVRVTLAFDHRVVNGADGARFLARLKRLLEDPIMMLL